MPEVENIAKIMPKAVVIVDTMLEKLSDGAVMREVLKNRFLIMDMSRKLDVIMETLEAAKRI